jgi:hypothetical protein
MRKREVEIFWNPTIFSCLSIAISIYFSSKYGNFGPFFTPKILVWVIIKFFPPFFLVGWMAIYVVNDMLRWHVCFWMMIPIGCAEII